jgi:hypothetical protein
MAQGSIGSIGFYWTIAEFEEFSLANYVWNIRLILLAGISQWREIIQCQRVCQNT